MKQKTGRKLLNFLLTLAMVVGLMLGMSMTALADDTTGTQITADMTDLTAGTYYISSDTTINGELQVSAGTVVINLNGHTLSQDSNNTSVIYVSGGNLTVNNGTITGGDGGHDQRGGGFRVHDGNVTVNNVTISDNTASWGGGVEMDAGSFTMNNSHIDSNHSVTDGNGWHDAGGVYLDGGTFTMNGGTIQNNTVTEGKRNGLVLATSNARVNISGNAVIYNNKDGDNQENLHADALFGGSSPLYITGALGSNAKIGISSALNQVFTSSENTDYNDPTKFVSDSSNYRVGKNDAGQLMLVKSATQLITAANVTAAYGDTDKSVSATTDGDGTISYAVKNGSEVYIDVNSSTGALTIKAVPADGKAYVTVTASATSNYSEATKDVTVTIGKATATIGHEDKSTTYSSDGISIPIEGMFTIPTGAGEPTYSVTNGTGVGSYENGKLTVTKCGTFTVTVNTAESSTHDAGNASATLTVNKTNAVPATITANNSTYDGTEKLLVTVTGTATGGGMQYALGTATEATEPYTTSIPKATKAGTYYVWYKVIGDDNHTGIDPRCIPVKINPKAVTVSGIKAKDKVYDGTTDAELDFSAVTLTGKMGSDDLSVTATGTFADKNVGNDKTVTIENFELTGVKMANYKLAEEVQQTEARASITAAVASLIWTDTGLTYNGQSQKPTVYIAKTAEDDCTVVVTGEQTDAGIYTATAASLAGQSAGNYRLPINNKCTFTIAKAKPTLDVDMEGWTYGGTAKDPAVTVDPDVTPTIEYKAYGAADTTYSATKPSTPGTYVVRASVKETGNYKSASAKETFVIAKKELTITAKKQTITYGSDIVADTNQVTADGPVSGDSLEGITLTASTKDVPGGTITPSDAVIMKGDKDVTDCYDITYVAGDLTIKPAGGSAAGVNKPTVKDLTYNGEYQSLLAPPETPLEGYTLKYSIDGGQTWSYDIPARRNAGSYPIRVKYVGDKNHKDFDLEDKLQATIAPKIVEIAWTDTEFTYDGKEHAPAATVSKLENGDSCNVTVGGAATAAGPHEAEATGLANTNYVLPAAAQKQAFNINKAALSVKANDLTIAQGDPVPTYTATVQGLAEGDSLAALEFDCDYTASSDAGTYEITPKGLSEDNYAITYTKGTLTVKPASASMKAPVARTGLEYDGSEQALVTAGSSDHGTVMYRLDNGQWSDQVPAAKGAGIYNVSWYLKADANYTSASSADEPAGTVSVTIGQKKITVSAEAKSKTFGGSEPDLTYTAEGLVQGDAFSGALCRDPGENVGVYVIRQNTLSAGDNYTITYNGANFTITKATAENPPVPTGNSLTYNGEQQQLLTAPLVVPNGYTLKYSIDEGRTWSMDIPTKRKAGEYEVLAKYVGDDNHNDIELQDPIQATIAQKEAVLSWSDLSFHYDGQEHVAKAEVTNLEDGDRCDVTVVGASAAVGTHTAEATALSSSNYKLPQSVTQDFEILAEKLEAAVTIQGWTYGEAANEPSVTGNTGGGKVNYTYAVKGSTEFGDKVPTAAGDYTVKAVIEAAGGYEGAEVTADFTIEKKTAILAWSGTSLTYNGAEQGPAATVTNLVDEDKCDVTVKGLAKAAGEHVATATDLSNDNYKLPDSVNQTYQIARADLTVTADSLTIAYGDDVPTYTAKYEGFQGEDKASDLEGLLKLDCTYTKGAAAGTYDITPSGVSSNDYEIEFVKGTLTVAKGSATVTKAPEAKDLTYTGQAQALVEEGTAQNGHIRYRVDGGKWSDDVPEKTKAGTYTVGWYLEPNDSYASDSTATEPAGEIEVTIKKAALEPTVTMTGWTYGDKASTPSVEGNTGEGTVTWEYAVKGESKWSDSKPVVAGEYTVKASIVATENYEKATATTDFKISKRLAIIGWEDIAFVYDSKPHVPSAYVSNIVKGDTVEVIVEGAQTKASDTPYTATATTLSDEENYMLPDPKPTQEFTITKGTLKPAITMAGWTYGDEPNAPKVTGQVDGDVAITYAKKGSEEFSDKVPTDAGDYIVKATITEQPNYNQIEITAEFTIYQRTASLAWSGISLTYNGKEQGPEATVTNLVGEDKCKVTVDGWAKAAGEHVATATALSNDNYKLPETVNQTYNIARAALTVTADSMTIAYGDDVPKYTAKFEGFQGEDKESDLAGTLALDCDYTKGKAAGTYDITPSGVSSTDYEIEFVKGILTVEEVSATVTKAPEGKDLTYTGQAQALVEEGTAQNGHIRYRVDGGKWSNEVPERTKAGTYTVSWYLEPDDNYVSDSSAAEPAGEIEVTIKKAALGPTVTMAGWTYGDKASTPSVEGNTGDGTVTWQYSVKGESKWSDSKPVVAGEYTVKASIAATENYEKATTTTDFKISKRLAIIGWEDIAFVYDSKPHVPSAYVSNIVKGDTVEVIVKGAQTKASDTPYTATATALSDEENYMLPDPKPTQEFTITKGTLKPAITMAGWTYGDEPNAPKVNGQVNGDVAITYAKKGSEEFSDKVPTDAGDYIVKATITEQPNYNQIEITAEFTIYQRTASLAWSGIRFTYNGSEQGPTATVSNLVGEDQCEVTVKGAKTDAGEYVAKATALSNDNYKLPDTVNQTFRIGEATIDYESLGYADVRDDKYHGIQVKVKDPSGAVVKYGTKKGKYTLDKSPTYKKDGTYTVYFQITADNYITVEGKETVLIMPKDASTVNGPDVLTNTAGARFAKLRLRSNKQGKKNIVLNWNKVPRAKRYVVYGALCNSKGHGYYMKRLGVSKKLSFNVTNISGAKLKKGAMHKFIVIAYNEDDKVIEKASVIHVATKGGKIRNYKGIKVKKPKKGKVTLKVGKTMKIKARAVGKKVKKHVGLRYESANTRVATVSAKGVIKAKSAGKCTVYVYTQNGKYKAIAVTVR